MPGKNNNARTTLHAVPDGTADAASANGRRHTAAEDKLWQALHTHPGSTAAVLADHAAIGRSTAGKILAAWATDGSATRISGIADGGRRAADTWAVNTKKIEEPTVGHHQDDVADPEPDSVVPLGLVQAERILVDEEPVAETMPRVKSTVEDGSAGGADEPRAAEPVAEPESRPVKAARLGKGALRGMVEDFLTDHPGEQFSPGAIGTALQRSSGAVANAVDKLVADGYVIKVQDAPKRYTAKSAN